MPFESFNKGNQLIVDEKNRPQLIFCDKADSDKTFHGSVHIIKQTNQILHVSAKTKKDIDRIIDESQGGVNILFPVVEESPLIKRNKSIDLKNKKNALEENKQMNKSLSPQLEKD